MTTAQMMHVQATTARNKVQDHRSITRDVMHGCNGKNDKPQVARRRDTRMSVRRNDAPRVRAFVCRHIYAHTNTCTCVRELHVSDKHTPRRMHRRCPLRSGPPPLGNNSKSRVINPSAVSSFPTSFVLLSLLARAVGVHACAYGCLCVASSLFTCSSLSVRCQPVSPSRGRAYTHTREDGHAISIRSPLFGMGYTCMTCIVVNCSHATAVYLPD